MQRVVSTPIPAYELATLRQTNSALHHGEQLHPSNVALQSVVGEADNDPPNGGLKACLKVFGTFCVFFITLGVASTFGAYQAYYETDLLQSYSSSTISWIGTTQVFLLSFVGLFSGTFFDRGHVRLVLAGGMFMVVLGLMMLSLAQAFWQILLAQGICIGFGSGLIYVPAVSIVSRQFTTKRTVALGIAATGSAVDGVVLPITFRKLLPELGFAWTNRVIGFVILLLASMAYILLTDVRCGSFNQIRGRKQDALVARVLNTSSTQSPQSRLATWRKGLSGHAYFFLCIGVFFVFLGYWVPYFYIVPFAELSLRTSTTQASYLLSILNAGSFFGRVLPAYASHFIGSGSVLLAGAVSLAVIVFSWLGISNVPGITVWCFIVGFSSGIVVSIPNAVASILSNPSNTGLRIGFMWNAGAFAELVGAPIAGALVKRTGHELRDVSYVGGQVFGGASITLGAAFLVVPAWSISKDEKAKASRSA